MPVQVPRMARDFSPSQLPVQILLRCLYSPLCASASAHIKNPKQLAAIPLFGHTKRLHQLVGMGSTALAAAVPCPGPCPQSVSPLHLGPSIFLRPWGRLVVLHWFGKMSSSLLFLTVLAYDVLVHLQRSPWWHLWPVLVIWQSLHRLWLSGQQRHRLGYTERWGQCSLLQGHQNRVLYCLKWAVFLGRCVYIYLYILVLGFSSFGVLEKWGCKDGRLLFFSV